MTSKTKFEVIIRDTRIFSMPIEAKSIEEARDIAEGEFTSLSFRQIEPMFLCGDETEILSVQLNNETVWENS